MRQISVDVKAALRAPWRGKPEAKTRACFGERPRTASRNALASASCWARHTPSRRIEFNPPAQLARSAAPVSKRERFDRVQPMLPDQRRSVRVVR